VRGGIQRLAVYVTSALGRRSKKSKAELKTSIEKGLSGKRALWGGTNQFRRSNSDDFGGPAHHEKKKEKGNEDNAEYAKKIQHGVGVLKTGTIHATQGGPVGVTGPNTIGKRAEGIRTPREKMNRTRERKRELEETK